MSKVEERLREQGLELPPPPTPLGHYVGAVQTGNLVYLSGHLPSRDDQPLYRGKLGRDFDVATGYQAAQLVCLNLLATLKATIGDLDRVSQVVKLLGMVNCTPDFGQTPEVINGASDLLIQVLGDRGRHARSAVGMSSLPQELAVEIEMIVEIE